MMNKTRLKTTATPAISVAELAGTDDGVDATALISVVIITRHRAAVLRRSLQTIMEAGDRHIEVIVVDNSDPDHDDVARMIEEFPQVMYIRIDPCINYMTLPRNIGLQRSRGDIIAFLDDDSLVYPDWFSVCRESLADKTIGIVGGRILDTEVEHLDHHRQEPIGRILKNGGLTDNFDCDPEQIVEIDQMMGCNWAFQRDVFEQIGGYDEFLCRRSYQELDLCLRAKQMGLTVIFNPKLQIYHDMQPVNDHSGTLPNVRQFFLFRNLSYVYAKNIGPCTGFYLRFLLSYRTYLIACLQKPTPTHFKLGALTFAGKLAGLIHFLWFRGEIRKRKFSSRLGYPHCRHLRFGD